VEILSPANTRTERADKIKDYESIGVPEVWVLSPEAKTVEVLQLESGTLRRVALLMERFVSPLLSAHCQIDLSAVFSN
jgi:Uma2 family endonuclease